MGRQTQGGQDHEDRENKGAAAQYRKQTHDYRKTVPAKFLGYLYGKEFWDESKRRQVGGEAVIKSKEDDNWDVKVPCLWEAHDEGAQKYLGHFGHLDVQKAPRVA